MSADPRQARSACMIIAALLVVGFVVGCSSSKTSFSEDDPAYMLAAIDNGAAGLTDANIYPYDTALGELEQICAQPRSEIGDIAVAARNFAEDRGADPTVLEVLQGSSMLATNTIRNVGASGADSCSAVVGMWTTGYITSGGGV